MPYEKKCKPALRIGQKASQDIWGCVHVSIGKKKYVEEEYDQSNIVCEKLTADLKLTSQIVINIGKVIQKEGTWKGGFYTRTIWMVQLILEHLVNGTPSVAISPNISSKDSLAMLGVKVIVRELIRINFIWSCRTILRIIGETLADYFIGKVE